MKKAGYLLAAGIALLLGCVPSFHELYTDQTLVFDPAFAGRWQETQKEGDEGIWEFIPNAESKSYDVIIHEDADTQSRLTAHLAELGGRRFFDFFLTDGARVEAGDWTQLHLLAVHHFLYIEQSEPNLVLAMLDPEKVNRLLEEKPDLVNHQRRDKQVLLTDRPEALQAFVRTALEMELFGEGIQLRRLAPDEQPSP